MLITIVLLWVAITLKAPLWVYVIVVLALVSQTLSFAVDVIDKVQKKQIERAVRKRTELLERYYGNKQKEDK